MGGREDVGWEVGIPWAELENTGFSLHVLFKILMPYYVQELQELIRRISSIFRRAFFSKCSDCRGSHFFKN